MEEFLTSPDGKQLLEPLITDPQALLQSMLSEYDSVNQQWANYGDNRAGILQAQKVAADAESAVAQLETDVVAELAEQQAVIQQKFTAYADVSSPSAIYTIKTGIRYNGTNYDAGLSVAATVNGSGGVDTRVAVKANQFVVMSGVGNSLYSPFVIKDGQVLISQAFIGQGWINNAMIGDYIQSNNYVAGSIGWRLDKGGTLEMNGSVAGQGRFVLDYRGAAWYNANGQLVAVMGAQR
ncbi:MAG: DUF1983 domain-containing protein [Staphylococcus lugdunensis]|nr:DUF1983 domain-containing protein [Staphylococcus lugdunensis]